MPRRYYEDFIEGSVATFGPRVVTREEIVAFAAEFDPQPLHLDEAAARDSLLGGLSASGWHACAIMMRFLADNVLAGSSSMGSPGIDEMHWRKPLRPGDRISYRRTVLEKRVSNSRPEMGLIRFRHELVNEAGETVLESLNTILFGRAPETRR
jgi:acyl dehydratase